MIPWSHEKSKAQAPEQQPDNTTTKPQLAESETPIRRYWRTTNDRGGDAIGCYAHLVFPARRQPDEFYCNSGYTRRTVRTLVESLQGTEQFGVAVLLNEY